jgi:hypothetical protein
LSTSCVSRRASTITSTAPESAVHARFNPATKQAKIDKNTMHTIANKPRSSFGTMWASRLMTADRKAPRKPKRKIVKLIASPMIAAGASVRENCENDQ